AETFLSPSHRLRTARHTAVGRGAQDGLPSRVPHQHSGGLRRQPLTAPDRRSQVRGARPRRDPGRRHPAPARAASRRSARQQDHLGSSPMTNLYAWLMFLHLFGLGTFLFAHGVSGGASLLLRNPVSGQTRSLLRLSQQSSFVSNPAILVVLVTGIWMTFAGHWSGRVWPWTPLAWVA